ncbi:DNA cytosine methyltransferase [Bifidobacterium sp. ESL0745]|uniref:DNA cytosine methyltransferase n=1 Tax=Bifidobacterium sp. ESL0745 TaxID=2983226 RepID=UPI0023F82C16|nr:DNA cytosine methyltransferase [Bifidobacterium sp. ESL0745]
MNLNSRALRYVSLFSGIEAASAAWRPLGFEPVVFSEIDPFCKAVLAERYPDVPDLGDVTKVNWSKHGCGAVDVVVGGSPCQSFSLAGRREGLKGASGLMFEYVRAVRCLRPEWFVWENVPGALTSEGGGAYRQLLAEMDGLGYGLAWRVLDAQYFGVAQRRRRVFLVGSLGTMRGAEVLFEPESLQWDIETGGKKRQALARRAQKGARSAGFYSVVAKAEGIGYEAEQSPTVKTDHAPAVYCSADTGYNAEVCEDMAPTLTAHMAKDAHYLSTPNVSNVLPALDSSDPNRCFRNSRSIRSGGLLIGGRASTLRVRGGKRGGGKGALVGDEVSGALLSNGERQSLFPGDGSVRRLTPVECERLQGFPDGWTYVPYNGKPHPDDGPRYRALGNSMAVPVMAWIGRNILRVEKEMVTDA